MLNWAPKLNATSVILLVPVMLACAMAQQAVAAGQGDESGQSGLMLETVVARMTAAQVAAHESVRAYTVIREYKLTSEKKDDRSEVTAEVNFVPPGTKAYEIQNTSGNGHGEKVVRRVLDHEAEMAGSWQKTAIIPDNYNFELLGMSMIAGKPTYVLAISPKRDTKDLLKGRVWVDAASYRIRRLEGEPVKSPSWWVRNVKVVLQFGDVRGMWLQTATRADADVRLFGHHVLESRDVDYRVSETVAQGFTRNTGQPAAAGTGARSAGRPARGSVPILGTIIGPR